MAQLGNHLVYDLLELADVLVERRPDRRDLLKVQRRRAVSNAYCALFHALSYICVDALLGWGTEDHLQEPLYRTLDHAVAKKRLASPDAKAMAPVLVRAAFANLQENRHRGRLRLPSLGVQRSRGRRPGRPSQAIDPRTRVPDALRASVPCNPADRQAALIRRRS